MRLIIVSGRSGAGKSSVLSILEDNGFYCVDNLPILMLVDLVKNALLDEQKELSNIAVAIDARNFYAQINLFDEVLAKIQKLPVSFDVIYLDANDAILQQRFGQTRRRHPLTSENCTLSEALIAETKLLNPIYNNATLTIDTSQLNVYQLADFVQQLLPNSFSANFLLQSFGFKYGLLPNADLIFDVRVLPNPYWQDDLSALSGLEPQVIAYFQSLPEATELTNDISNYLAKWLPKFEKQRRHYVTIGIGCTGGFHRSVYVAHNVWLNLKTTISNLQLRHRDLTKNG